MLVRNAHRAWQGALRVLILGVFSSAVVLSRLKPQTSAEHAQSPQRSPVEPLEETGFVSIFDGKTLNGWDGDPDFWRVEDGAIVGQTSQDHQPKQNTFCIWRGGQPADFEFKAE